MQYRDLEDKKRILRDYAIRLMREIGVRCKDYQPDTPHEQRQQKEGVIAPSELDVNKWG